MWSMHLAVLPEGLPKAELFVRLGMGKVLREWVTISLPLFSHSKQFGILLLYIATSLQEVIKVPNLPFVPLFRELQLQSFYAYT